MSIAEQVGSDRNERSTDVSSASEPVPGYDWEERPWGSWHVIDVNDGYKIKRIHVKPGSRLSYQTHEHRSEHWVVVSGIATCTIDDEVTVAGPGESVDVGRHAKHRLANEGTSELVIIEVQRGSYTGEDDIVRIEDDYGRCAATSAI